MNKEYIESLLDKEKYKCPVCGQKRYVTDQGNHEWTIHCSSPEARFWEYERGTLGQTVAKYHWDQSRLELYFSLDDVLRNVR
jgi:transcription elongation factor Elf1